MCGVTLNVLCLGGGNVYVYWYIVHSVHSSMLSKIIQCSLGLTSSSDNSSLYAVISMLGLPC